MYTQQSKVSDIRVLIVDDHPIICESLTTVINQKKGMVVVGAVASISEAFQICRHTELDVIVLDLSLSDGHGLEFLQNLKQEISDIGVVIFSMYDETAYAERAIRLGALGYVMKSSPTKNVIQAILNAYRGDYYVSQSVLSRILRSLAHGRFANSSFPLADLTDREIEVYQLLGQGMDTGAIARHINLSRKTIETYRRNVKEKLELDSINALLQHAIRWTQAQAQLSRAK